jgi:hypothetical protein
MIAALAAMSCSDQNRTGNATANGAAAAVSFQPGLWEMRPVITLSRPTDRREMPTEVVTSWCMSPAEAQQPSIQRPNSIFFPSSAYTPNDCIDNLTFSAGRIQGTRECRFGDLMASINTVTGHYTPTSFELEEIVREESSSSPSEEVARIRTTGRRLGDCPRQEGDGVPGNTSPVGNQTAPAPPRP